MNENGITLIDTAWGEQHIVLDPIRTEDFSMASQALSDYINGLNLPADKNNELVSLAVAVVSAAERGAWCGGFAWALKLSEQTGNA